MSAKPVRLRPAARGDIGAIAEHYRSDAGLGIALAFTDALQRALYHLAHRPGDGAPHHAQALDLPSLRTWPVRRFPHLVAYVEAPDGVDVWRVLHGKRDVPAWLRAPE